MNYFVGDNGIEYRNFFVFNLSSVTQPIASAKKAPPSNVYNLMDALRASIKGGQREKPAKAAKKPKSAKPAAKRKAG